MIMDSYRSRPQRSVRGFNRAFWLILALLLQAPAIATSLPPIPAEPLESIRPTMLRKHLEFLASDELGGRYTLSPGNKIAARYLAAQLESFGYRGAAAGGGTGGDSFFQKIAFNITSPDLEKSSLLLTSEGKTCKWVPGEDYRLSRTTSLNTSAELVYVGYGVVSPSKQINDYANVDVKGKVVVLLPGAPPNQPGLREFGVFPAAQLGAIAAIAFPSEPVAKTWASSKLGFGSERVQLARAPRDGGGRWPIPLITLSPEASNTLLSGTGRSLTGLHAAIEKKEVPALALKPSRVKVQLDLRERNDGSQNVVGILDGADPNLRGEHLLLSAHYDHVETRNGEVYNGADDDGSGTAAVLEIARAFSLARPRRSIMIVFHTAEELGLLGSRFFADIEPLVPLSSIVANLNIDMIGRSRSPGDANPKNKDLTDAHTVYVIGSGRISPELRQINEETTVELGKVKLDYRYEENDTHRFYSRSDHFNYAKHGIPIAFFFTGEHEDYHQPTDDVEKIDFDKMSRIAQMIYGTAWRVANLDLRLRIKQAA